MGWKKLVLSFWPCSTVHRGIRPLRWRWRCDRKLRIWTSAQGTVFEPFLLFFSWMNLKGRILLCSHAFLQNPIIIMLELGPSLRGAFYVLYRFFIFSTGWKLFSTFCSEPVFIHHDYSVLAGCLAPKEGPSTFACKSQECLWQDWYIFSYIPCANEIYPSLCTYPKGQYWIWYGICPP